MHFKFSEGVPLCCLIQQGEDDAVEWFWEKSIKDGYRTLEIGQENLTFCVCSERRTCRMSLKSRAASFFISDALFENFRMVPFPNVGTIRNLATGGHVSEPFRLISNFWLLLLVELSYKLVLSR